jgi:hypothetical protein
MESVSRWDRVRHREIAASYRAFVFRAVRDGFFGTLPMRGSRARISSQACRHADSKSGESAGRSCQPGGPLPGMDMERRFGKSRRSDAWWSFVVISQTPLSATRSGLSRSSRTICWPTYTPVQPNMGRVSGDRETKASKTKACGMVLRGFFVKNRSGSGKAAGVRRGLDIRLIMIAA